MRFVEFADAEAQLGLLRTIIDNTWSAIAKQAEEQRKAEAQRKAAAKLKPVKRRPSTGKAVKTSTPKPPPPPPHPKVANPQPKQSASTQGSSSQRDLVPPNSGAMTRDNNFNFDAKSRVSDTRNGF